MTKNRIFSALLAMIMLMGNAYAANPKREMRSTWFTTVWGIDWPSTQGTSASAQSTQKNQMISYLDKMEELNMTSMCFQVRSMGDAMYPSKYAPWSSYVSGERGTSPGWDPLAFFVEEAHKRGIEAYVWLNPYRWSSGSTWSTDMDNEWKEKDMLIAGTSSPEYITFNPGLPETRQLIVNVIKEILNNYNIDGILFDDYFYASGGTTEGSSAPDYALYKASGTTMSIGDWRRRNVNDMVADCYNAIKETRPDVRFGISPAGVSSKSVSRYSGLKTPSSYGVTASDWQYAQIYSDPLAWLEEGTIDFISPQCYWLTTHSTAPFGPLTKWWSYAADYFGLHYYASHSVSYIASADKQSSWTELASQIKLNRQYVENNAQGSIYYSTKNLTTGTRSHLKSDVYSTPSLSPQITWKSGPNYDKVANLAYNNGTLTWDATQNGNAIIRYRVYAVPMTTTFDQAQAADGDGIDVQYLQKVEYSTSYTVDSDKQSNYWYAVCVLDGYSKEHTVAVVNYPEGESEKTTLVAPINGAATTWDTEFSWTAVADATYTLEISDDAQMSNVIYSQKNIDTNKTTVDLSFIEDGKTCYWRVRSVQPKKLEAVSEVATFVAPKRVAGPAATLSSPENGAEIEEECTFVWKAVEGDVESYTIEVSADKDFATIKYTDDVEYSNTTNDVSLKVNASLFGKGTFFWRVKTKGSRILDGVSEVRSFTVTKISVGTYEPGYAIKTDKDSYADVDNMNVESVWFRSIRSDYNNISFGSNGGFNRGMCVAGENVYLAGRNENSSGANTYLRKYNIHTGECMGDLKLGSEASMGYYPCNDVIKDSKGNVCITNLSLNIGGTPFVVMLVDLESGAVTEVGRISTSKSYRVDHVALWGDVTTGNFKIYAAIRESKIIMRWTFENGKQTKEESCTVSGFYSGSGFGTAPRVVMIDENSMFVDGGSQPMTRYNFATGAMEGSFKENEALMTSGVEGNGCNFFTLNGKKYVVYSNGDDEIINSSSTGNTPWTFNIVSADDNMSFASMKLLWTLPQEGLGDVYSSTMQAPVDYAVIDENTVRVVLYVPGCGLCAYDVTDTSVSGVESIFGSAFSIVAKGNRIVMSEVAQKVAVYDIAGTLVAQAANVAEMSVNLNSGVYIVTATVDGETYAQKVVLR